MCGPANVYSAISMPTNLACSSSSCTRLESDGVVNPKQ